MAIPEQSGISSSCQITSEGVALFTSHRLDAAVGFNIAADLSVFTSSEPAVTPSTAPHLVASVPSHLHTSPGDCLPDMASLYASSRGRTCSAGSSTNSTLNLPNPAACSALICHKPALLPHLSVSRSTSHKKASLLFGQ